MVQWIMGESALLPCRRAPDEGDTWQRERGRGQSELTVEFASFALGRELAREDVSNAEATCEAVPAGNVDTAGSWWSARSQEPGGAMGKGKKQPAWGVRMPGRTFWRS